jgi:hypothetical protein
MGGPGDYQILLRFTANRATIEQITSVRTFRPDEHLISIWNELAPDWSTFAARLPFPPEWWKRYQVSVKPEMLLQWRKPDATGRVEASQSTWLLWDPDSECAYVSFGYG